MPRGGHKVKPVKVVQVEASTPSDVPVPVPTITKLRRTNAALLASSFLSRTSSTTKVLDPISDQPATAQDISYEWPGKLELPVHSATISTSLTCDQVQDVTPEGLLTEPQPCLQPISQPVVEEREGEEEEDDKCQAPLDTFECQTTEAPLSGASSLYSRSSASIYSRASSIYSSEASIYSFDDDEIDRLSRQDSSELIARELDVGLDTRLPNGLQYQQRARPVLLRRQEAQDAASRERSTLAKKAALFKNSRLAPQLPPFSSSLPTWSMVCRAAKASQDCYDSQAATRRGIYTPADSSKDIKAMIVDDQLIDDSRLLIVSIRGTQSQSLADWSVNTTANPTKPVGFLDDDENACHAGFLQVTRAMVGQVAAQLQQRQQHLASSETPKLLFTGHSAGGAIAAILYSHMVSTSVHSELTALTNQFSSINCVTFGAPPVSQAPLPRRDHIDGVFLSFANEGDLVLRTSNAAYFKSLAKLMTTLAPSAASNAIAPPPVKVVRGSRGAAVYRQTAPVLPPTPWEELPLWPTPAPSLTNAGDIVLLRDGENGNAVASSVTSEDLKDVIFGDLAQHTIEMYLRRVKEVALNAMFGRDL